MNERFEGKGERQVYADKSITVNGGDFTLKIQNRRGGSLQTSALKAGGPYEIGRQIFSIITSEDGDDNDFNDSVVKFTWRT